MVQSEKKIIKTFLGKMKRDNHHCSGISQEKGNAVKRCTELHKLAMANRAYSGFRW